MPKAMPARFGLELVNDMLEPKVTVMTVADDGVLPFVEYG